jgi:hypothetical protein
MKSKALLFGGLAVLFVAAVVLALWLRSDGDPAPPAAPHAAGQGGDVTKTQSSDDSAIPSETFGGSQASYPLDLQKLRSKIPDNRYWQLDMPTSDVDVAKERAEKAQQRNAMFGRIQANEASEQEIRAYYDERRRVSKDYLELALMVLDGQAGEVSERDRGLFELTANLHRARLKQVEIDQSAALGRIAGRGGADGSAAGSGGDGASGSGAPQ